MMVPHPTQFEKKKGKGRGGVICFLKGLVHYLMYCFYYATFHKRGREKERRGVGGK